MSENQIILLENVSKWFGDFQALKKVSLSVDKKKK